MPDSPDARAERIKELFADALSLGPAARVAVLEQACVGDAELRKAVDDLLENYHQAHQFFAQFPEGFAPDVLRLTVKPTFSEGELVAGRFRIVGFIGAGGMGEVYEAEDLLLEREHVALKTLPVGVSNDGRAIARLTREMALARRVTHPNVCRVFDVDQHVSPSGSAIAFFTMELLNGESLAARLQRSGALSIDEARPLVRQIVAALSAAHSAGIVHGDFKPGNIMLVPSPDGRERLVITDFGLARRASTDATPESANSSRLGWGTPVYMAPEQFAGRHPTRATDVYALGAVVFEMVMGKAPIEPGAAVVTDLDPPWRAAIARCLDRDPNARFATADEFLSAFTNARLGVTARWRVISALTAVGLALMLLISPVRSKLRAAFGGASAASSGASQSVAILAFAETDSTPDGDAFGQGLAAALTDQLGTEIHDKPRLLFVSASALPATDVSDPAGARRRLGANVIVTGRVVGPATQRRVTVEVHSSQQEGVVNSGEVEIPARHRILPLVKSEVGRLLAMRLAPAPAGAWDPLNGTAAAAEDSYIRGRGHLERGRAPRFDVSQLDLAVGEFQRTIDLDGQNAPARAALGEALVLKYEATKDTNKDTQLLDRAERNASEATRLAPTVAYVHVVRALTYLATGRHSLAIPLLEEALRLDPDIARAREDLVKSYLATGQLLRAEQTLTQAIARRPHDWSAHEDLGVFRLNQGQYKDAETHFLTGREYAPDNPRVISNLAALYTMTELFDAAEQELKRGLEVAPDAILYNNLGWTYFYDGNFLEGVATLTKAASLKKNDSVVLAGLARGYRWMGHDDEARATCEIAIAAGRAELSAHPANAEVRANLAYLYAETGNDGEAGRMIDRAVQDAPLNVRVRFTMALVLELTGQRAAALDTLQSAINSGHPTYQIARHPDLRALRTDPRVLTADRT